MKPFKAIAILALLLLFQRTYAQPNPERTTECAFPNAIGKTLFRTLGYPQTIGYAEIGNEHCFLLSKDDTIIYAPIEPWIDVNDIFVYNNQFLFFCGQDIRLQNGAGLIGYFDIHDLFHNNGSYYCQTFPTSVGNITDITQWNKVIAYNDPQLGYLHVVSIGEGITGQDPFPTIVEFKSFQFSNPSNYTIASPQSAPHPYERFDNLLVTDNYVATTGRLAGPNMGISVRVFDKYNLFSTSGMQDYAHIYPSNDYDYPIEPALATVVGRDTISTISLYSYSFQTQPTNYNGNILEVFSLSDMVNYPNSTALYTIRNSVYLPLPDTKMQDFIYDNIRQCWLFSQTTSVAGNVMNFVSQISYQNPPTVSTLHISDVEHRHILTYDASRQSVTSGGRISNRRELNHYEIENGFVPSQCATPFPMSCQMEYNHMAKDEHLPLQLESGTLKPKAYQPQRIDSSPINTICQQ